MKICRKNFGNGLEKLVNNTTKLKKERGVLRKNNLKSDKALIFAVLLITMSVAGCQDSAVIIQNAESSNFEEVPSWYLENKEVAGIVKNRDANEFIYGVGFAISADLEFAKRKALALAKTDLAKQINAEVNENITVSNEELVEGGDVRFGSQSTLEIESSTRLSVQGYLPWQQEIQKSAEGNYKVYVGIKIKG